MPEPAAFTTVAYRCTCSLNPRALVNRRADVNKLLFPVKLGPLKVAVLALSIATTEPVDSTIPKPRQ